MVMDIHTAHLSFVGGRRRNEDALLFWDASDASCWVVSDGAGGHGNGDLASRIVVETVIAEFRACQEVSSERVSALIQLAQAAVLDVKRVSGQDMYATCVVLLVDRQNRRAVWGHVGDSRLYMFREGRLCYQTRDHSLVQNMIDAGYGSIDMIRTHPNRNMLTSAIGNDGELETTVSDQLLSLIEGDTFLLCSDGWWEHVTEQQMEQLLAQESGQCRKWLDAMASVVAHESDRGGDNYSALSVAISAARQPSDDEVTVLVPTHARRNLTA
ncbi:MAG: serine/threonine-protein phosphatase [Uliginosibacterium sp.]|nr:serine/threonine-protein phosphatase [Uliginosibacterium sp.]